MSSSSSSSSSSTAAFSPDHFHSQLSPSSSDQLCYVHCNFCDTVLAVCVPCSSLFKTVTVRCGHCTNLLSVNMSALLLPQPNQLHHFPHPHPHSFFTPHSLNLEEIRGGSTRNMISNPNPNPNPNNQLPVLMNVTMRGGVEEIISKPVPQTMNMINRTPEKRQRVPSAYNRFIKDEIQRIKAGNPEISHRKAFSTAAKNWAHFPHIHFGLLPEHQPVKKANMRQQDGGEVNVLMKDGFFATNNVGVYPY